jgi:nitrous oxidase accessory protein
LSISFLAQLPQAQATVRQVPDEYPTIQAAVDAADPGDIIEVSPGVYPESVIVETSLTIIGQDKLTTIVDGSGGGSAFWLGTDGVTIKGFTMRDCSNYGVIAYYSGGHTIDDNIFLNNRYGVFLTNSPSANYVVNNTILNPRVRAQIGIKVALSNGNTISGNYISESTYGIEINDESQLNYVTNNTIMGTSHGIYIRYSSNNNVEQNNIASIITGIASVSSDYVNILNNTVSECAYGIELYGSTYNTVFANTATQNGYGIYLVYASDNTINGNLASNNYWGIRLYESDLNMIIENTFSFNAHGIELISYSTGNTIAWNNILNNTEQMHQDSTSGANTWNKMTGGKTYGNYWSNYTGEDTDDPPDGVGDTRLPHRGVDNYPLMNPWSTVHDLAIISVTTSNNEVYQGQTVNITVVARNEGTVNETFNVTAKYFNRIIETKIVTNLTRLKTTTLVFNWNTTNVPLDFDYEIKAETSPVADETDKKDNIFVDGTVHVMRPPILGDADDDGDVDCNDLAVLAGAYGSSSGQPTYDTRADFDNDGDVDYDDLSLLVANYGKTV